MNSVIDTSTFQIMGAYYFKDKNHIYDFSSMSDGGSININWNADVKTFRVLESGIHAKDKNYCYYRGRIIKGADLKTFKVLDTSYSFHTAYDKRNYYDREIKMSLEEIKESNLDSIRFKR